MGKPLVEAIASLARACFLAEYYPLRFRVARTIVLWKLAKPDYSEPGAWRPIALLSTIGKVIETLAAHKLSNLAEQNSLLPDTQIGNRKNRSTKTALELIVEQIYTIWGSRNHVASILLLDITGAFDSVNYTRLFSNFKTRQISSWLVSFISSFLTNQATMLVVDNQETPTRQIRAGVLQGSLLLPILFLFYIAPLLEGTNRPNIPIMLIGFADNINLLTYSIFTEVNCINLEQGYSYCLDWARTYRMHFSSSKY